MLRLLPLLLALLLALPAWAVESTAIRSPRASVTLVSDAAAVAPGQQFQTALRLVLAPGWHSYWRNAGDAGTAPDLTLHLPDGASAGPIAWPAPERIPYGPLVNFGYTGQVLLPVTVSVPDSMTPGDVFSIRAEATWLVCAEVCIPEEGSFSLTLPVAPETVPSPIGAPLFEANAANLSRPLPWTARAGGGNGRASLTLVGTGLDATAVRDAFFFPFEPGLIDNTAPQTLALRDGTMTLGLVLAGPDVAPQALQGTLVLHDGGGQRVAFDLSAPFSGPVSGPLGNPMAEPAGATALWRALLLALAGGLILNLMPCVFPVLAMKAMALARMSGAARREIRLHAAAYTAGVLVCFAAIGGLLVALRAAGLAAGWGFQFTQPAFVAAMAWLVLAVGLNLSGVFVLGRTMGAGQAVAGRGGLLGAFATGGLAVLLATPCTAPFMAAALGAALVMPPASTMAVFLALGLGLAAPYALLGVLPGLARALPKPGAWMEKLRQALAFPMYATGAWLVWVLSLQAGSDGVLYGLGGAVVLAAGLWALGLAQRGGARGTRIGGAAAAGVALLVALALLPRLAAAPAVAAETSEQSWSAERVAALRAEGRPVFVNVTAAWCITCQVNDRVALQSAGVRDAFAARDVAYLIADWTRGDAAIGALLRSHGREGVPLYLYWARNAAEPILLPQILTEGLVLEALAGR